MVVFFSGACASHYYCHHIEITLTRHKQDLLQVKSLTWQASSSFADKGGNPVQIACQPMRQVSVLFFQFSQKSLVRKKGYNNHKTIKAICTQANQKILLLNQAILNLSHNKRQKRKKKEFQGKKYLCVWKAPWPSFSLKASQAQSMF